MNIVGAVVRSILAVLALISATVISAITLFVFVTLAHPPTHAHAQSPCGNIIEEYDGEVYESPIEDCDNPFGIIEENNNLQLFFGETEIVDGNSYEFVGVTESFDATGYDPRANSIAFGLYKHNGENYYREPYYGSVYTFDEPGMYTFVIYEDNLQPVLEQNILKRFARMLIPTAYAFPGASRTFTFEVVAPEEEPAGISNILFLPGMQGSRLYMKDGGVEEKLWEPFGSSDYENLRMTDEGESENSVYTRDAIDEIYGGGSNIYKTFIQFLEDMDGDTGPVVQVFPYDWRYSVSSILENGTQYETGLYKKLVETVNYLATLSKTKKVTIIAHSNGGLLAKALMMRLESLGKADQVDKIIFIATPHIGTPKAVAAILHGYDQEQAFNLPADARDIRKVTKNMPGPYGLLPSEAYIDSLNEPLISFDNSTTTKPYRDRYGFTINNISEYRDFLLGAEGRVEDFETIALPTKVNNNILDQALEEHATLLDEWQVPEGVEVFNIVGTGLTTPKAITYQRFDTSACDPNVISCYRIDKLEPVVEFTRHGDETVVLKSSEFTPYDLKFFANLNEIGVEHANITESESIQILIDRIVHGSSTEDIEYISNTEPTVESNPIDIDKIHSPARIYIEDQTGKRTGRDSDSKEWKEEIPGTDYYEIGGVKYLFKPKNLNHKVVIEGEGNGIFTYIKDELVGEEQKTLHRLVATVTPSTRITYTSQNGTTSPLSVDQNGDGTTDYQLTIDGKLIDTKSTYLDLKTGIRNLKLPKLTEIVLIGIADQAEQFFKKRIDPKNGKTYEKLEEGALYLLDQSLVQLRKGKLITQESYAGIKVIIDKLIRQ